MDLKCVQGDMKGAMLSPMDQKHQTFAARGIFSNGTAYTCLICDRIFANVNSVPGHMAGKRHCVKLDIAHDCYFKVDGCFACKICPSYVAAEWKSFLCHLIEKDHYDELNKNRIEAAAKDSQAIDTSFSYIPLLRNQITECVSGTFFCCCCQKVILGRSSILRHIDEKRHQELIETCRTEEYPGKFTDVKSLKLVKSGIVHVNLSTFNCKFCDVLSSGVKGALGHISTNEHVQNVIKSENAKRLENQFLSENKKEESPENPSSKLSNFIVKVMRENSITGPLPTDRYQCKLCDSTIYGLKNVLSHVDGAKHKKSMDARSIQSKPAPESEETSDGSSSSWVSTGNSSESWESYEGESESSYENSSCVWESSDKSSGSWETVSIHGSSSESQKSLPFEIPPDWVSKIPKHCLQYKEKEIFCPLCQAHLQSLQSLMDHVRSKYHVAEINRHRDQIAKKNNKKSATSGKSSAVSSPVHSMNQKPVTKSEMRTTMQANVADKAGGCQSMLFDTKGLGPMISKHMLEFREPELFCVACQVRLQSRNSLMQHTKSKNHSIRLVNYKTELVKQRRELADSSGRNSASSSVTNAKCKAGPTIPKAVTKEAQPSQAKLFDLPDDLIPLLALHSLQRFEQEVFCPACQVHLRHVNNLIEHTNSRYHIAELKRFRAEIAQNGQRSGTISKTNAAASSAMNLTNEKASNVKSQSNSIAVKTSTSNPENAQSSLMEIPKNLLPLIAKHSLRHLKHEIYCVACKAHLQAPSSLVDHTNSPRHAAALELFKASTLAKKNNTEAPVIKIDPHPKRITSESENKTGLEDSMSRLTIVKGGSFKKLSQNPVKNTMNQPPRQMRPRKQDNRQKKSRAFDPKYLKVDMQHIYEINPEKLRIIELSCQLCFHKISSTVYCLICERSVPSKLQTLYEHICSSAHTVYLAEAEANDKHFVNYPDQFSDLALAKEYMQEVQKETIQCLACDASIENDDIVILEHVRTVIHRKKKQLWKEQMEKVLENILAEMTATWYNIQKYWCQPCDIEYNTEFHFAEHMESKKHQNCLKKIAGFQHKLVYDSCIACATLWQGFAGVYPQHCEQPMHKYLVQSGDFSVCKLPNQAVILLKNAEAEVTSLIELSDQVLTVQKVKADTLLKCLEDTVKPLYPSAKAYPFGSRVSGLGFPDSDIDVFLDCGTYDGKEKSREYQEELINCVEWCLRANQKEWEIEETLVTTRTPIIKLRHRATELRCDVSFKNGLSVENTKLLKCFIDNYPPCRKLMLFLKKWLSYCNLSGSQYITNYATCWYVIFYLQRKLILPSVASMIAEKNESKVIDGWETGISEEFNVNEEESTFTELLHGFFDFYTNFDYRESVACPIVGRSLLKQDFTELDRLPNAMAPYINHVKTKSADGLVELFRIDSEMCIQDPYDLSHNLTKAVRKFTLNRFKRLCATSAEILNNFIQH